LDRVLGGRRQVRLGETVDVLALRGIGAWFDDRLVGLVTWRLDEDPTRAELAALAVDVAHRGRGVAGALTEAAAGAAKTSGCTSMWLLTTNDNLDALRLYQRHGFGLVEVRPGGVDLARQAKPSIPEVGAYGIPLRDELILERDLTS
ncbi:MAG: GNAT family N-acetyltransferase, partial [Nocardioidaceae bacterium]